MLIKQVVALPIRNITIAKLEYIHCNGISCLTSHTCLNNLICLMCLTTYVFYLTPAGVYIVFRCVDTIGGDILDVGGETA